MPISRDPKYHTVAKAMRIERVENTDDFYIVFKITDELFKQKIRESWADDIELIVIGKNLVKKDAV